MLSPERVLAPDQKKEIPLVDRSELPPQIHKIVGIKDYTELKGKKSETPTEKIYVSESLEPFGPPPTYYGESGALYTEYNLNPTKDFLRKRHDLKEGSDIVLGFQGSNEMLERIALMFEDDTSIWGVGPHFTGFRKHVEFARRSTYEPFSPPLDQTAEATVDQLTDFFSEAKKRVVEQMDLYDDPNVPLILKKLSLPSAVYISNPNAGGDFVTREKMAKLIDQATSCGIMMIVDEALGDFFPDEESVAQLTDDNSYLVVARSLSKGIGLPGEGLAYIVANQSFANEYRSQMRDHHFRGDNKLLMNQMSTEEVFDTHLKEVRFKTKLYKELLLYYLDKYHIKYLPTSLNTPIVFVDGLDEGFAGMLDMDSTPGSGYFSTYNKDAEIPFTDRFARIGLPFLDYDDSAINTAAAYEDIAKKILGAINANKLTRDRLAQRVERI